MKQRYNITIEYETMEEARKYINNVSAYLQKCLERGIENAKHKEQFLENSKNLGYTTEEDFKKMQEIANVRWTD